jgi:hypothetical protein
MIKFTILFLALFASSFAADSVKVEPQKYVVPFNGINVQDSAIYRLPVVTGGVNTSLMIKLNSYLSADSLLGENIDSIVNNYKEWRSGIVGSDYNILYNKNSVLSISVYVETLGAYPSSFYSDVNLDITTGNRILITDIIDKSALVKLAERLDKVVQKRIKDAVTGGTVGEEDALQFFEGAKFTVERLSSFAFTDNGIMFYYNFGLPHAVMALSPDEDILITWEDLKYFVKDNSLLDKVMHK